MTTPIETQITTPRPFLGILGGNPVFESDSVLVFLFINGVIV